MRGHEALQHGLPAATRLLGFGMRRDSAPTLQARTEKEKRTTKQALQSPSYAGTPLVRVKGGPREVIAWLLRDDLATVQSWRQHVLLQSWEFYLRCRIVSLVTHFSDMLRLAACGLEDVNGR